nr:histidine kinase [uncultured Kingella sp.]
MSYLIPQSLLSRLTLLVTTWLISAFVAIGISMMLSWRLEGGAAAVNDTGGLRYQTYRLRLYLNDTAKVQSLIQTFDQTLIRLHYSDPTRPLFIPQDRTIMQHLNLLHQYWEHQIKPQYQSPNPDLALLDNHLIPNFVSSVDNLTRTIERNNAQYVQWLRVFQMGLMVLIFVVSAITIILLKIWIIRPLKNLEKGVTAIQNNQFGEHIPEDNSTEFSIVDNGFNRMSSYLAQLYGKLEQQVAEKTQDLVHKNQTLNTLYTVAQELNQTQTTQQAAQIFLPHILALTQAEVADVYIGNSLIARQSKKQPENRFSPESDHPFTQNFNIRANETTLGTLTLHYSQRQPENPDAELVQTLVHQLALAISNNRLAEESRQYAVLQERNTIAQGLHDSIAQSLSYLNLQTQMLENAWANQETQAAQENLQYIQAGIQECYDDVRELLQNFRTKITQKNINEAIETLALRLAEQTHIQVHTEWHGNDAALTPSQQLQFIFILQESLSNIRKHAQAQNVTIRIDNQQDYTLTIIDDGIGFNPQETRTRDHIGLNIMQERAQRINATLTIQSQQNHTQIQLTLPKKERIQS